MEPDVLERYKKVQAKFNLPHLNELTGTFHFEVDDNASLIDTIRMEVSDRLFTFTERILEPVVGGGDAFCCFFEQDMVNDAERERLFRLYRKVQALKWENNLLTVRPDEKRTAEWIRKAWDFWNGELSAELTKLCRAMSDGWSTAIMADTKTNYHG